VPKLAAVIGPRAWIVEDKLYRDCSYVWARCGFVCLFGVYSFALHEIDTGAFFRSPTSDSGRGNSARVMHQWPLRLEEHVAFRSMR
jgi:hypothetical protein